VAGGLGAATVTRERTLLPDPQYQNVNIAIPRLGNYLSHQLQLNVKRRFSNGLFVSAGYTNGKKMSDSNWTPTIDFQFEGVNETDFQDGKFNRRLNRSLDPNDVSQRLVVTLLYELPFGHGKRWNPANPLLRTIAGGWQMNSIGMTQTGLPLVVRGASNFGSDRPNSTGVSARLDNPTVERWFDTTTFLNPPDFTLGNVGRTLPDVRGPGTSNWDLSLLKNTRLTERFNLQFRAEAFNFLNKVNLGTPNSAFTAGKDGTNSNASMGTIDSARDARVIQFGLKLLF